MQGIDKIDNYSSLISRLETLLSKNKQFWAVELSNKIYLTSQIEEITDSERFLLYTNIVEIWEEYILYLSLDFEENWPFIYNAFIHLFDILVLIEDYSRLIKNGLDLVKILINLDFASDEEIADYIDSLAVFSARGKNYEQTTELIFLSNFFRGRYLQNEYFDRTLNIFYTFLKKIAFEQRIILINNIFGKIYTQFLKNKMKYRDFIESFEHVYKFSIESIFYDCILHLNDISHNSHDSPKQLELLHSTIFSLQIIKGNSWAYRIVDNYCEELKSININKAIKFLKNFMEICYKQGEYNIAFVACSNLSSLLPKRGTFQLNQIRLWAEWTLKFRNLSNKRYFIMSVKKFKALLDIPVKKKYFIDFCYAKNEYYRIIRGYLNSSEQDFWYAALHRSIFEEGFEKITEFCINKLQISNEKEIISLINEKVNYTITQKKEKKDSSKQVDIGGMIPKKIIIKMRIPYQSPLKIYSEIYYTSGFSKFTNFTTKESWDEPNLNHLYRQLPIIGKGGNMLNIIDNSTSNNLNQQLFGKLAYLFLPKSIRDYFDGLNLRSEHTPELLIIIDRPYFPFEMIHDDSSPLGAKFAIGYRFREPALSSFKQNFSNELDHSILKFTLLSIGDLNQQTPEIWDENTKKYYPIHQFKEGSDQRLFMEQKMNNMNSLVDRFSSIKENYCTKEIIEKELSTGSYNIIHFSSNLFYLEENPKESFFLTSDNKIISFQDIVEMLSYAKQRNELQGIPYFRPLIIFDGRIIGKNNIILSRFFEEIYNITKNISSKLILGILSRISNEFNDILKLFLGEFINLLLLNESIGASLLKAYNNLFDISLSLKHSNTMFQILQETHYIFVGDLFQKLE